MRSLPSRLFSTTAADASRRSARRRPPRLGCSVVGAIVLAGVGCSGADGPSARDTTSTAASPVSTGPLTNAPAVGPTTSVAPITEPPIAEPPTTEPPTTVAPTTTTEPLMTEGAVVLVANAAAVPGAATQVTGQLGGIGFTLAEPTNAAGIEARLETTKVYFLPPGEAVARSIVRLFGDAELAPMPTPVWIDGANEALGEATVVVMLGADHAAAGIPPR